MILRDEEGVIIGMLVTGLNFRDVDKRRKHFELISEYKILSFKVINVSSPRKVHHISNDKYYIMR